jgi:hypothetical protein
MKTKPTKPMKINAPEDPEWLQKAQYALDHHRPFQLTGDEQQIAEFEKYKLAKERKLTATRLKK